MKWTYRLLFFTLLAHTHSVFAADDWWFDIEVIIFDRNTSLTELSEKFETTNTLSPVGAQRDLISEHFTPNISWLKQGLKKCHAPPNPIWQSKPTLDDIIADYKAWQNKNTLPQSEEKTSIPDNEASNHGGQFTLAPDEQASGGIADDNSFMATQVEESEPLAKDKTNTPAPVTALQIASYWLEFSGIDSKEAVSVKDFSYCEPSRDWLSYDNGQWVQFTPDNHLPTPASIPEFISGTDWPRASRAHLLSYDSLALKKLSRQIRQTKGLNRLLHIAWRQKVKFGQDNAARMRIVSGNDFSNNYRLNGSAIPNDDNALKNNQTQSTPLLPSSEQDDFFVALEKQLATAKPVSFRSMLNAVEQNENAPLAPIEQSGGDNRTPIWKMDGYLKVFLKSINRVPYLHIESELEYRQPVPIGDSGLQEKPEYELVSVPFRQVRRVISKQLHYFDHPLFGMVVEIRRYQRPPGE